MCSTVDLYIGNVEKRKREREREHWFAFRYRCLEAFDEVVICALQFGVSFRDTDLQSSQGHGLVKCALVNLFIDLKNRRKKKES